MFKYFFTYGLLLSTLSVFAQASKFELPPANFYKKAIIYDTLFRKMEVRNISLQGNKISFLDPENQPKTLNINELEYFKVRNGTYVLEGLGGGAIAGLLSLLLYSSNLKSGAAVGTVVGGSIALGGIIGLCSGKTKTYRLH